MKTPLPFSVFKRGSRPCYLVAFKNEKTGAYLPPISTRQTDRTAAIKTAYDWFRNGVPQKNKVIDIKEYTLRDLAKEAGRVIESMMKLNMSIIDIKESHVKGFEMIENILRETTGLPESSSDSMAQPAIISLNAYRVLFSNQPLILFKRF